MITEENLTKLYQEVIKGTKLTTKELNSYGFTGKDMMMELLDELGGEFERMRGDVIGDKIATMACKAAVKGNMRISAKEADALIEELLKAENPYTCPHGRPTIISMTKTELEKKFKRIV